MKYKIFIIIIILLLLLNGNVDAQQPQRIVSLAPSITESLYVLGASEKIVGVTTFCTSLASDKEKIGTLLEPNLEKIISLSPDLVIASRQANRPQTIDKLNDLGLKTYTLDSADTFSQICWNFRKIAKIVGKNEEADKIISQAKTKIKSIGEKIKAAHKPSVFWEVNSNPLITVSKHSFVNEIIKLSGGNNIFAELPTPYPVMSREEVVRRNPGVIILVTMGKATAQENVLWSKFNTIGAVKNKRIYIIDSYNVCQPTPFRFIAGVEEIAKLLHPNIFK